MSAGVARDVQIVGEGRPIAAGARERVLLAGVLIGVDQREDSVQIVVAQFTER